MKPPTFKRKVLVALTAAAIFAGVLAATASAHQAMITIGCTSVDFSYTNFTAGENNQATEIVTVNGQTITKTFTFTTSTASDSIAISGQNGDVVSAGTEWTVDGGGSQGAGPVTLSGCSGPPPTQTIAGDIFDCTSGTPTMTEVPGGTLGATGPQTVPTQPNPLAPTDVAAGTYTMSATAPSGYHFVQCGSTATIGSPPTSATESVNVPSGGSGVGIFYVAQNPPPTCPPAKLNFRWHYIAVNPSHGSSWSGTYTAPCPGALTTQQQAMEGALQVPAGTTLYAGYDFTAPGNHATFNVSVTGASVTFTATCPGGGTGGLFTVPIPDETYTVTNDQWIPSGNQSDLSTYQGSATIPTTMCNGGTVDLSQGGVFTGTVS